MYLTLPKNSLGLEKILFMGTRTRLKFLRSYVKVEAKYAKDLERLHKEFSERPQKDALT